MRDEDFIRGSIPMTKSEVRAVSISKLELKPDDVIYDIGAGTGSVSVEAALLVPEGRVYAFEEKDEGCSLIKANAEKFGVKNITVIPGHAPESFANLPAPDCVFIGGSNGSMKGIIKTLVEKDPNIRIVANAVTLETLTEILKIFKDLSLDPEIVCVNISRAEKTGQYHLMKAQNPVYILSVNGK